MNNETELHSRQYWDKLWGRFLKHHAMIAPSGKLVQLLLPHVERGAPVLDLGCGEGRNTIYLGRIGYRAIGLDLSRKAVRLLANNLFDEEVRGAAIVGDARSLPFPDNAFGGVLAHNLFDHLDPEGFTLAMTETRRVVVEGGILLMTLDPIPEGIPSKEVVSRDDGVRVFVSGPRKGMLLREMAADELPRWQAQGWSVLKDELTPRKSSLILLKKRAHDCAAVRCRRNGPSL